MHDGCSGRVCEFGPPRNRSRIDRVEISASDEPPVLPPARSRSSGKRRATDNDTCRASVCTTSPLLVRKLNVRL
ncbi:unnamed protein product, partial [Nesidiocoris tenuis]